jgi:hypothetical protein
VGEALIEGDDHFPWVVDAEGVTMVVGLTRSFVCVVLLRPLAGRLALGSSKCVIRLTSTEGSRASSSRAVSVCIRCNKLTSECRFSR